MGVFRETTADPRTQSVPLSHASLELGHLYLEDCAEGPDALREHFAAVRPWADAVRATMAAGGTAKRPRISTCFLIDDYFARFSSPAALLPMLLAEAEAAGLSIDYLARESGCVRADGVDLAEAVERRLVESPPPGSDGTRPPVRESGWLSNGERTPAAGSLEAMSPLRPWRPPAETAARRHSVFLDIELWDDREKPRVWACPFLAAVWQLVRLGLLRHRGEAVMQPRSWTGRSFPDDWDDLPPLIKLNEGAAPFAAYRTYSVMPSRFMAVEHAVRVILEQVDVQSASLDQIAERAAQEGITLPPEIPDRAAYVFLPGS